MVGKCVVCVCISINLLLLLDFEPKEKKKYGIFIETYDGVLNELALAVQKRRAHSSK